MIRGLQRILLMHWLGSWDCDDGSRRTGLEDIPKDASDFQDCNFDSQNIPHRIYHCQAAYGNETMIDLKLGSVNVVIQTSDLLCAIPYSSL